MSKFQSTHPVRGATTIPLDQLPEAIFQSTHPVRGATAAAIQKNFGGSAVQSTHPVRGATKHMVFHTGQNAHFNPRTPCGVRRP